MRESPDRVAFYQRMAAEPYKLDFYQTLRRLECFHPDKPRLGKGMRPADEPIRLGQEPSMSFAPATLAAYTPPAGSRAGRLDVRFFGLLGPNGPMPLHMTEHARERLYHADDATFVRFLDIMHHRFTLLFYRAWAQAQPTVSLDRPHEDRFAAYIGALIGLAGERVRERDSIGDFGKLYYAGLLGRQIRNRDGLAALLAGFFKVPSTVEEFSGHWMRLPESERTRLGWRNAGAGAQLGVGAVIGARVWDRQHKIRIRLGPLTLAQYERFLPGGKGARRLAHWMQQYLGLDLDWDVRLELARDEAPHAHPGKYGRLGWTTWLGTQSHKHNPDKLLLSSRCLSSAVAQG